MAGRILLIDTLNDAFSAKDVPFGVRKFKFNNGLIKKKSKKLQWHRLYARYSHNFWFYGIVFGLANSMATFKFTPG